MAPSRKLLSAEGEEGHRPRPRDASLHDLAVHTFQTDQSFGTLAGRMVDRWLIERVPGPGRVVKHRLTDEGERLRASAPLGRSWRIR